MAKVKLTDVSKVYKGNVRAVSDFNLEIADGEFVIFVGPSGCGKSTTLRMVAGLEEITSGKIYIDGVLVNDLEPKDRDIAMVFQNYSLYPHMSVFDNLGYSLKCHREKKEDIEKKVRSIAELLNISELLERKPKELSGGQRQRVALGRCLIREPKVFLFDEPLSNLDAKLRVQMRSEISKLHKQVKGTFIYVTHDQTEAMTMGDRIVVMKDGFIQQVDTPVNLYEHPTNMFVASFLGSPQMNFFQVRLDGEKLVFDDGSSLELNEKTKNKMMEGHDGSRLTLGIRPSDFLISTSDDYDFRVETIELTEKLGNETLLYVSLPGKDGNAIISLKLDMVDDLKGPIYLKVNKDKIHLFDENERSILRINEFNYVPVDLEIASGKATLDGAYEISDFERKRVCPEFLGPIRGMIRVSSRELKMERTNEDDYSMDVVIAAKDVRSNACVYFAKDKKSGARITFEKPKGDEVHELGESVRLFVPLARISVVGETGDVLMINEPIESLPIVDAEIEKHGNDYYVVSSDKAFAKAHKFFLLEKIYDLNSRMLLVLKDQNGKPLTLRVAKNEDFFNGMLLYVKFRKV